MIGLTKGLRNIKSKTPTIVYVYITLNNQRVIINTKLKALPAEWDFNKHQFKVNRRTQEGLEQNQILNYICAEIEEICRKFYLANKKITPKAVKAEYERRQANSGKDKVDFFQFYKGYIEECVGLKKHGTIQIYRSAYNLLKQMSADLKIEIEFETFGPEFNNLLIKYLQEKRNSSVNTIAKYQKVIRTIMNESLERNLHNNLQFKSSKCKRLSEKVEKIFLTKDEIKQLRLLNLNDEPKLDVVRDLFLIGCYTSLRYSDYSTIVKSNIIKNEQGLFFSIMTKKTNQKVVIPIHPVVKKILKKYNYQLPKSPCNQITNQRLKKVGLLAGINTDVEITKTIGGVMTSIVYKKYELMTTHVARRSMITNAFRAGIAELAIRKMSGHKSAAVFESYVRVTEEMNAQDLVNHEYFNK
jgi:integrase